MNVIQASFKGVFHSSYMLYYDLQVVLTTLIPGR